MQIYKYKYFTEIKIFDRNTNANMIEIQILYRNIPKLLYRNTNENIVPKYKYRYFICN